MQKLIGLIMVVFVLGTGTTFAKDHEMIKDMTIETHVSGSASDSNMDHMDMGHGSATTSVRTSNKETEHGMTVQGSSASDVQLNLHKFMQAAQVLKQGVPGVVTSVASSSFVMTIPSGKDHATTTFTVNVSSSTKYSHASSTAALSNISAGSRVVVLGAVSADAKSITAERVIIVSDMKIDNGMKKGFFERFKHFFTGKHASTTEAVIHGSGSASAEIGGGFVGKILHSLFGWM